MPDWDLLLTNARAATMAGGDYGVIDGAAVAIADEMIVWIGEVSDLPAGDARESRSLDGRWLTPALIDCHTHLAFAGNRAAEFEQRLKGFSYEQIARAGGGIMSTVNATRAADEQTLLAATDARLALLKNEGCATVEIKSGYGLDVETELRLLSAARQLGEESPVTVRTTFLGAHAIPAEFRGKADDYIALVCDEMLPEVHARGLADAVDAYCESIAFSPDQVARVFEKATSLGLPVKLHADQLSDGGGAELAATYRALSADHLEYTHFNGVSALAEAGTIAVLLPGAFLTLGETQLPPVNQLRDDSVPIAIATDCNPGTSPVCSMPEPSASTTAARSRSARAPTSPPGTSTTPANSPTGSGRTNSPTSTSPGNGCSPSDWPLAQAKWHPGQRPGCYPRQDSLSMIAETAA
jgi:imidazolonepropionase